MRRLVAWIARFASTLLLRRLEVADLDRLPRGRPVLIVANHFYGFVDPLVIATSLGRLPRFVAKAGLGKIPVAGFILRKAGVVFVHRQMDKGGSAGNESAFRDVDRALAAGDTVAIFPEGTTHDRSRMDPLKTGAARMALGGRTAGAEGLVIVPIGITYPDKVALRPTALVQVGRPIELDVVVPVGVGADDREAVEQLTAVIDRGLRAVVPDFPDVETQLAMEQAAQVALSSRTEPDPSLQQRYELSRRLGRAEPAQQEAVRTAMGRYATMLSGLHLGDRDIVAPTNPSRVLRSAIGIGLIVVVLGGLVVATALVNAIPAALVALVGLIVKAPVSKGTYRALVGLVAFPVAWVTAAVLRTDGFLPVLLVTIGGAVGAVAAILLVERAFALTRMLFRWQAQRERARTIEWAAAVRVDVVEAVDTAAPQRDGMTHVAASDCEEIRPGWIGQPANTLSSLAFVAAAIPLARAGRAPGRGAWRAVAWSAAVEGLGSVAYHGPGGVWSKRLHDAGLVALVASMAVARAREPRRVPPPRTVALSAAAVALHTLSRTGGPLCSCRSPLQGHAVFHLLAAAALASAAGAEPGGPAPVRTGSGSAGS